MTAEAVVTAHLERIAAVNSVINAVVQLDPRALDEARAADRARESGAARGPLDGVPFTVKDVIAVEGIVAAAGVEERRDFVPGRDATAVARLRDAGAILLGKTNTPPFGGGGETDNPVYGRTRLPHDPARTPGGSSGGEAALLAAHGSPLGLGSDSGGSLRVPAHFCGVATLKPTYGRIPRSGFFPPTGSLADPRTTLGPIARFARDLALVFPILCGPDGRDPSVPPVAVPRETANVDGLRVALYADDGMATPTDATVECVREAGRALARAGASVAEAMPPDLDEAFRLTVEYWQRAKRTGEEVEEALRSWDLYRRRMMTFMERFDLLLCPVCEHPAPPHGAVGPATFRYTAPYSLTGAPVAVVRAGTSPEGLPIGVQLAGAPWREDRVLAAAIALDDSLGPWPGPDLPIAR